MFHAFLAAGRWQDRREANLLDGGAHFYRCYTCADGGHVAVGCIEPQFYAECLRIMELEPADFPQMDVARWPELARGFAQRFAEKTRDEWAALFAGTDACVTPVLSLGEAPRHAHNQARGSYMEAGGITQAAPAPRFAAARTEAGSAEMLTADEALSRWT
jgi:alpha-methylacyl-CoA racemase